MTKAQTAPKSTGKKGGSAKPAKVVIEGAAKMAEASQQPAPEALEEERRHEARRAEDQANSDKAMQFAVSQMTAPAAKETAPVDMEGFLKAQAELAAKFNIDLKKAPVPAALPVPKQQANGITRPKPDTLCGKVWRTADEITVEQGRPATIAEMKVKLAGVNDHTVKTQYARWRQYNGATGRIQVAAQPAQSGVVMTHEGNP